MPILLSMALFACVSETISTTVAAAPTGDVSNPIATPPPEGQPMSEFVAECEESLGPVPGFDCEVDGIAIDVRVNGVPVDEPVEDCDAPSTLTERCVPRSRVGRIEGDGNASWVFICRAPESGDNYDIVAMIGHEPDSGATCFFQAWGGQRTDYTSPAETPELWEPPATVADQQCHQCHAADAFIRTPWIDSARMDDGDTVIPAVAGPNSPYEVLGQDFRFWRLRRLALPGNSCTRCHRMAGLDINTVRESVGRGIQDPWMPPQGVPRNEADIDEVLDCIESGQCPTLGF